jgi:hypothetical protein
VNSQLEGVWKETVVALGGSEESRKEHKSM